VADAIREAGFDPQGGRYIMDTAETFYGITGNAVLADGRHLLIEIDFDSCWNRIEECELWDDSAAFITERGAIM
jgi:hypothetical protein